MSKSSATRKTCLTQQQFFAFSCQAANLSRDLILGAHSLQSRLTSSRVNHWHCSWADRNFWLISCWPLSSNRLCFFLSLSPAAFGILIRLFQGLPPVSDNNTANPHQSNVNVLGQSAFPFTTCPSICLRNCKVSSSTIYAASWKSDIRSSKCFPIFIPCLLYSP